MLYDAVWVMPTLRDGGEYTIVQKEREGRRPKSDSDDEGIPDPEIHPCFSIGDLSNVQYCYDHLCVHYQAALGIGFYNAVGKLFMTALGDYVNTSTPICTALQLDLPSLGQCR